MEIQEERRKVIRNKPENADLIYEKESENVIRLHNGKINDISYIGMGIEAEQLPEVDSIIKLDFRLYPEQNSIISLAKVVWTDTKNKRFGVEFKSPSEEFMGKALGNLTKRES